MAKPKRGPVNRRGFLKGAAAGAAASAAALAGVSRPSAEGTAGASNDAAIAQAGTVPPPSSAQLERDAGDVRPPASVRAVTRPGSDLMVQMLRDLGIEFVAANPGSSFEGLQESIINYGTPPNSMPELITALHEEWAVAMAHGYGKAEGRPMAALVHGSIGVQHAAMS